VAILEAARAPRPDDTRTRTARGLGAASLAGLALSPFGILIVVPLVSYRSIHGDTHDVEGLGHGFLFLFAFALILIQFVTVLIAFLVGTRRRAAEERRPMAGGRIVLPLALAIFIPVSAGTGFRTAIGGAEPREFLPIYGSITPSDGAPAWRVHWMLGRNADERGPLVEVSKSEPVEEDIKLDPCNYEAWYHPGCPGHFRGVLPAFVGPTPVVIRPEEGRLVMREVTKPADWRSRGGLIPRFVAPPQAARSTSGGYTLLVGECAGDRVFATKMGDHLSARVTESEVGIILRPPLTRVVLLAVALVAALALVLPRGSPTWRGTRRVLAACLLMEASFLSAGVLLFFL
jgi:hypothetical protein